MEITPFTMYLFTRLDSLNALFGVVFFISVVCVPLFNLMKYAESDELFPLKTNIILAFIIFFFGSCAVLIPTQKEAAAIMLIPKIVNSEKTELIADKSFELLKLKLDEYIFDLKDSREKESK